MTITRDEANKLLKASGYGFNWDYLTEYEFYLKFGFNPSSYPQYFTKSKNFKKIVPTSLFRKHCDNISSQFKAEMNMLIES